MAFFFNWIGFLCSICLFNTIAGRCGALSGLGLSIVKWICIVRVGVYSLWLTQTSTCTYEINVCIIYSLYLLTCNHFVYLSPSEWKENCSSENNYEIKGLTCQLLFLKLFITINDVECFCLAQQVGQRLGWWRFLGLVAAASLW